MRISSKQRVTSREKVLMAATMTKTQLVRLLAEKLELSTNKQAAAFLETLAEIAVAQTKKNGVFVLPGLGRLKKVQRKARTGRNPQTGEPIKIKAKTTAKFYLSKAAKDAIAPPKK
jgi:DNA-binding protein HU-beta